MQSFILVSLCAFVLAAPQGYQYNEQQSSPSIGTPNFSLNNQASSAAKTQEAHSMLQQAAATGNFQQTLLGSQNSGQNAQLLPAAPNFFQAPPQQNFGFSDIQQQQQQQQQQLPPFINSYGGQLQPQQYNSFPTQHQSAGTITKDIYVHVAPEDASEQQQYQRPVLPPPPPRKHYRIVFIKAPSQTSNNAALRIQQAPTEEKTIIYVLTKKADPLDLQTAFQEVQPKVPSKPEVYFIKYKTKEEAQYAQRTIQAQYDQLGGTSQVSDEGIAPVTSVIGSLKDFSQGPGHISSSASGSNISSDRNVNSGSKYIPPIVAL